MKLWRDASKVKRVTVFRALGGIGDILMLTPVFRGLKEKYGKDCHVTAATDNYYLAGCIPMLLHNNPFIDEIIRVNPKVFVTPPLRHGRAGDFHSTPNEDIPYCVKNTDLIIDLNVVCAMTETQQQPNVVDHRTDIWCRAAGVEPSCKKPILQLTADERREGRQWVEDRLGSDGVRIGVVLTAVDPARDWPFSSQFAWELAQRGYKVVTIDKQKYAHQNIPAMLGMHIRQVAAATEWLDAVVTPDTGILHVAGTLGVPVFGIFGPTPGALRMREYAGDWIDGSLTSPCSPCWYQHPCRSQAPRKPAEWFYCMRRASKDLVLTGLERMLARLGKIPSSGIH